MEAELEGWCLCPDLVPPDARKIIGVQSSHMECIWENSNEDSAEEGTNQIERCRRSICLRVNRKVLSPTVIVIVLGVRLRNNGQGCITLLCMAHV